VSRSPPAMRRLMRRSFMSVAELWRGDEATFLAAHRRHVRREEHRDRWLIDADERQGLGASASATVSPISIDRCRRSRNEVARPSPQHLDALDPRSVEHGDLRELDRPSRARRPRARPANPALKNGDGAGRRSRPVEHRPAERSPAPARSRPGTVVRNRLEQRLEQTPGLGELEGRRAGPVVWLYRDGETRAGLSVASRSRRGRNLVDTSRAGVAPSILLMTTIAAGFASSAFSGRNVLGQRALGGSTRSRTPSTRSGCVDLRAEIGVARRLDDVDVDAP